MNKKYTDFISKAVDSKSDIFIDTAKAIHSFAELSLMEFKSAEYYCKVCKELGFEVKKNICDIETAFTATFVSPYGDKPKIAILAEYDALSGLSQVPASATKEETEVGGNGHGCGHNILGAGALAAAVAVKDWLVSEKMSGTVVLCGCPGEEGGAAKAFMAKKDFFVDFDSAITWHPGDVNTVCAGGCNACIQTLYKFYGIASHAAGSPERGRSALDAVELMNIGVQFLREHMPQNARIHYAITETGGPSPNVVQPYASVLYMVRSPFVKEAVELQKRVDAIADGAAMMTETTVKKCFIDGTSDTIHNEVLCDIAIDALTSLDMPTYTKEELEYADAIAKTYNGPVDIFSDFGTKAQKKVYDENKLSNGKLKSILDFIIPHGDENSFSPGSTDVGDVSYQTPAVQVYTACFTTGAPGHSWQNVSLAGSSIGFKGMLYAAKAMALTATELYSNPDALKKAQDEFKQRTVGGFTSPIPDGAVPVTPNEA